MAVPPEKLGVTVNPPCTALSTFSVKVRASPSAALVSAIVTVAVSSSLIVPVAGPLTVTPAGTGGKGPAPGKGPRR